MERPKQGPTTEALHPASSTEVAHYHIGKPSRGNGKGQGIHSVVSELAPLIGLNEGSKLVLPATGHVSFVL